MPPWINDALFQESAKMLAEQDIQYGNLVSYHQMCRWNSGFFYKHPALADTRWYWRVEPGVHFFCDVDYDVFRYMQDRNKTYGFAINLYDAPQSIPTLWPETERFVAAHPDYLHPRNARDWLVDAERRPEHNKMANGYSTCHFWSNFEIGDMTFWRSKAYQDYFDHLDRAGGFFYERWGDAPVHSIALGLFEDKSKIHWYGCSMILPNPEPTDIDPVALGFEISAISTYHTLTAPIRRNAKGARQASSRMEKTSCTKKTAGGTGSSTWGRIEAYCHGTVEQEFCRLFVDMSDSQRAWRPEDLVITDNGLSYRDGCIGRATACIKRSLSNLQSRSTLP